MAVEFLIKTKTSTLKFSEGETVYYPYPKANNHVTLDMLVHRIVEATSLATGDVRNAVISLAEVACAAQRVGSSVDLGELGWLRLYVPPIYAKSLDEVSVEKSLGAPRVRYVPKRRMLKEVRKVKLSIDHTQVVPAGKG